MNAFDIAGGCVTDADDPVAEAGGNRVLQLHYPIVWRGNQTVAGGDHAGHARHPCGQCRIDCWRRVVKMDDIGWRFLEEAKEVAGSVRQVPAHIRLNKKTFISHPFAECAKCRNGIDTGDVPLIPLQAAHLRHQRFGATHFHAVDDVRNPHRVVMPPKLRQGVVSAAAFAASQLGRSVY